ncbi:MAG: large subunit ribosomal protein [Chloroflexota bacterium]|jgi:large subunit ribosomal protein L13|nr:large subunit ribosomal protein [Chloroflexota bacterium]
MDTVRSYTPRAADITRAWHVIDATGRPIGRLASETAQLLKGKHKPIYATHMDVGDYVVVINAARVGVTGKNKAQQKMYYRHSGYPGALRAVSLQDMLARHPERVIEHAVHGMLPKNSLGRQMLRKLRVYAGPNHPHIGQVQAPAEVAKE